MVQPAGAYSDVILKIEDGPDLSDVLQTFNWKSTINNGYVITATVFDPNLSRYQELTNEKYYKEARRKPLKIKFKMEYKVGEDGNKTTSERIAYITNLDSRVNRGGQSYGMFELIAIDPPTWFLNRGDADGTIYKGSVSDVIKQVINKYAPGIAVDISSTVDSKINVWHTMRQDPKTFITTLLDWSSSVTNNKTNWVVASVDEKIIIKEQAELQSYDLGTYSVNSSYPGANSVGSWERIDNNYLTNIQTRLASGGISSVSGLYCDPSNPITEKQTIVDDENTSKKKNVRLTNDQGFIKPKDKDVGWSYIRSIPEDSSGALGIPYQNYIDGRARNLFISSLDMLNRLKVKVLGSTKFDDSSKLGVSTVYLTWTDARGDPWTGNAKWLVYGFEHTFKRGGWQTIIYLNRKDVDSSSQKVN